MRFNSRLMIALLLVIMAGTLRYYRVGHWPFTSDELSTFIEQASLFADSDSPTSSQFYRLPRLLPLSHSVIYVGCRLFGSDEFGSRVLLALLGTLIVPITFLILDRLQGRTVALATSILLTLWPDHIWFGQVTRFYIVVAFFSYLSFLVGAWAVHRRSVPLAILACCLIFAATLSHTVTVLLLGVIFAGLLAASVAERQPIPWKMVVVFLGAGGVIAAYLFLYALPLLRGWNQTEEWGYSSAHALLAAVNMIGWPTSLFAGLGLLLLITRRNALDWYWVTCGLASGAIYAVLPKLVTYQPSYAFPFVLPLLVCAGAFIASVYEELKKKSVVTGVAWVGLSCLMGMPSLMSYYQDGSRPDYRTAGRYVNERWIEGDRGASFAIGTLKHYAPRCDALVPLKLESARGEKETTETLERLTKDAGRFWFVVTSPRGGLPEPLRNWLGRHCSHELIVRRRRFDSLEFTVDVYLYSPKPAGAAVASVDVSETDALRGRSAVIPAK